MFKVISDIIAYWYEIGMTIVIAIRFCNGKKMICALMFIISYHYGIICLSNLLQCNIMNCFCNLLQLEQCKIMFKATTYIMTIDMKCEIQ